LNVTDTLPQHTSYVSGGTLTGNVISFSQTSLAAGITQTFTFQVRAASDLSGIDSIANQAIVTGGGDTTKTTDTSDDTSCVECPTVIPVNSLIVWKTVSDTSGNGDGKVELNEVLTYTIHVKNNGSTTMPSLAVTDTVPAYTSYVGGGDSYDATSKVVSFTGGSLAAGATATFTFQVRSATNLNGVDTIYNQAVVIGGGDTTKSSPDTLGDCEGCQTKMPVMPLVAWKTVADSTGNARFSQGDKLTYTIHVWNISTQTIAPVTILDTIPANTVYIDGSASGNGQYDATGNSLIFTLSSLAPGATDSVTFDVRVEMSDPTIDSSIVNQATVIAAGDTILTTVDSTGSCADCKTRIGLPVTGLHLNEVQLQGNNNALLTWGTTTEFNSKSFTMMRSTDGGNTWVAIGTQPTKAQGGNSSIPLTYNMTDPNLAIGTYEYQVIETDIDGDTMMSNVVRVQITGNGKVYPNPANTYIRVELPTGAGSAVPYRMISADGKVVLSGTMTNQGSYGQISVSSIASDIYFLQVTVNNMVQTYKVQIQH
jgi:uncharacterized repeat protein (TIGR01451 family)